jgi:hypothetical protein
MRRRDDSVWRLWRLFQVPRQGVAISRRDDGAYAQRSRIVNEKLTRAYAAAAFEAVPAPAAVAVLAAVWSMIAARRAAMAKRS